MKANSKDFKLFKSECQKWIDRFGLYEYSFSYAFRQIEDGWQAGCLVDDIARACQLILCPDWGDEPVTDAAIKDTAYHEVCELLIHPVRQMLTPYYSEEYIYNQIHRIINILTQARGK